mgnify:CR=1 FL=1
MNRIFPGTGSVANPKWQDMVDLNNLKIESPYATLKHTLGPLFSALLLTKYISTNFCRPVVQTESNYVT